MPANRSLRTLAALLAIATTAAACGSSTEESARPRSSAPRGIAAVVASYELVADRPQRFIIGLLRSDQRAVVSFGRVELAFAYLGTESRPTEDAAVRFVKEGTFRLVPGQTVDPASPGPRFGSGSEGTGVYGADDVVFDTAGFWGVQVVASISGTNRAAQARFAVLDKSSVPAPGDPAPRTEHPLAGAAGINPRSIDSRADAQTAIPDPELHSTTIRAALAAGRPLVVAVSTPTYCVSRFCGPITDTVQKLAQQYGDRVAFVHLEVWEDFEAKRLNPAAKEWISPDGGDAKEPWTFVVDRRGIITDRFDNVATDDELQKAVTRALGA